MSARTDVEELLNTLMPYVEGRLSEEGMLEPFGAVVTADSKQQLVRANPGAPNGLMEALIAEVGKRVKVGDVRVTAIVADVTANLPDQEQQTDAVQFRFEHIDEYTVEVFIPYTAAADGLVFGKLFGQPGDSVFFPPAAD